MQFSQTPQYVTHRAQQQLIKEFSQPSGNQTMASHLEGSAHSASEHGTAIQDHFFKSQRVLSSDPAQQYAQIRTTQPLVEPHSAQIPTSQSILSSNYQLQSARPHLVQSNRRSTEKSPNDLGNFAQARGYMQNIMGSKSSMTENLSARQQSHVSETQTGKRQLQKNVDQPPNSGSYPRAFESESSIHVQRHKQQMGESMPSNSVNPESCSYNNDQSSVHTGKDFADMVSIETANCNRIQKQKQGSKRDQSQTNYTQGYDISVLSNTQKSSQNFNDNQTAIYDSKKQQNHSNHQLKSGEGSHYPATDNETCCLQYEKNDLSKSLNFSRATIATTSNPRDNEVTNSSRIVPQMYMKQMCQGLNNSAVGSNKLTSGRKNIQIQRESNGQKYQKQHSAELKIQQSKSMNIKQSKSSERPQKQTKAHGIASYSPFQNRLYHQYQSSIPATSQVSYNGNTLSQTVDSNVLKDLVNNQFFNYMIQNKKESCPDTSYCTSERQMTIAGQSFSQDTNMYYNGQQNTQYSAHSPTVCLQHPQVIEQSRKLDQSSQNGMSHRQAQMQYQMLMNNTTLNNGSLTKSQEFEKVTTGNNTVIHEGNRPCSIGHENSNYNGGKQRHSSATYKRPNEDAYDKMLDRNQLREDVIYSQRQRVSSGGQGHCHQPSEQTSTTVQSCYQRYKDTQHHKVPQKNQRQVQAAQAENQNSKKNGTSSGGGSRGLYQTQVISNKSACETARVPGPIIASGPLNPIGQKSPVRASQLRQSASGMSGTSKVPRTCSRKSLGLHSNLGCTTNSRKMLETAKQSNLRASQIVVGHDDKHCSCSKSNQRQTKTAAGQGAKNQTALYKSPLVQSNNGNTIGLGTHRGKQVTYSANQTNEQPYPRVSPKSTGSVNKGNIEGKFKKTSGQIHLSGSSCQQTTASNARGARHTPSKLDQQVPRKQKISPFKATNETRNGSNGNQYNQHHNLAYVTNQSKQLSPDQNCNSVLTADLKYLYERQKKMVAQLSQNKIGSNTQTSQLRQQQQLQQNVPGLSLETINEKMPPYNWSQTPKQQQNVFTPSSAFSHGNASNVAKTVRGNPPASYQAFITQQATPSQKDYYHHKQANYVGHHQTTNSQQPQMRNSSGNQAQTYSSLLTNKVIGLGESRQQPTIIRKSSGVQAITTHRDFVQENKRACAQSNAEKLQNLQVQQQRGAQSQGKTPIARSMMNQNKEMNQNQSDVRSSYVYPNNSSQVRERATPSKKALEKKDLAQHKYKTRNEFGSNKTQYLTKKSISTTSANYLGHNPSKNASAATTKQNNTSQLCGNINKSPSYKGGLSVTQIIDLSSNKNLASDVGRSSKQRVSFEQKGALALKKQSKTTGGLNMTINIQSNKKQGIQPANVNTYRGSTPKNNLQKYCQTQPEDTQASKLSHVQKSQTMQPAEVVECLRTVQSSQIQNDSDIFTFALQNQTNGGTIDTRNPTFQQQIDQINQRSQISSEKVNCVPQIQECSREALLLQKQVQMQNHSGSNPTARNSNTDSHRDIQLAPSKIQGRNCDVQNILINSNQSKNNTYHASMSSKGIYNNSKLGVKMSHSSPTNQVDDTKENPPPNIISFQQIQEKSLKSLEPQSQHDQKTSPQKRTTQRDDKENFNIKPKAIIDKKQSPGKLFFNQMAEQQKNKRETQKKKMNGVTTAAIETTQNDESENKPATATNKTNVQQNIQQYMQAQNQERQALAPQSQNVMQPLPNNAHDTGTINAIQQQAFQQVTINQNQNQNQNNVNDTMCFSQKSSLEDYVIGKQIGQGAYAVVRIGLHKPSNKKVALKIYKKYKLEEPNRRKSVKREIKLMEKMKHESIVQLYEIIDTQKYVILIMEYVGGGSLHGYLKSKPKRRLEEWDAKRIFKQIIEGLRYCHSRCITHRDIKLENLLLDNNKQMKIIDFGFSTCIPNDKKIKIFCGTPSYMAPEIVLKTEYCGPPADIWAMGVLLFTILSGQFPYRGATDEELYDKICRADYHIPKEVKDQLSPAAKDLLAKLFSINADQRPTAKQILEHQWLYNIGDGGSQLDDSINQIQSSDCLQLQKRAKSQRLDCIGAPKNKNNENQIQQVEKRVAVNPFNIVPQQAHANEPSQSKQQKDTVRSLNKIGSQAARSSSHAPVGKSNIHINNKVIDLISAKLGYDPQDVENQVRQDLMLSENNDSTQMKNQQTSFVGNLYFRLLDEEDDQKCQKNLDNRDKSDISASEQNQLYLGSDIKSQQKSDNGQGYNSNNMFNQTQQLLIKSAISQTSLGMSGTGGNMTSQGFGQGNNIQNFGIQPSYVPSVKSMNSGGGQTINNTASLSQLPFNNTLTSSANFNSQVHQHQKQQLGFNNTQPLKGMLHGLNEVQQFASTPDNKSRCENQSQLPLNFTQTNIFVTNNNQVFGGSSSNGQHQQDTHNSGNNLTIDDPDTLFNMLPTRIQQQQQTKTGLMNNTAQSTRGASGSGALMVNNFFTDQCSDGGQTGRGAPEVQESPNFRKRDEPSAYGTRV